MVVPLKWEFITCMVKLFTSYENYLKETQLATYTKHLWGLKAGQ